MGDLEDYVLGEGELASLRAHGAFGLDSQKPETSSRSRLRYELYGICEHQGSQMQDGHYVAYVNSGPSLEREEWFGISDSKLWRCERSEVLKIEAYIAFYRRV